MAAGLLQAGSDVNNTSKNNISVIALLLLVFKSWDFPSLRLLHT
jgi:hypothetical protein